MVAPRSHPLATSMLVIRDKEAEGSILSTDHVRSVLQVISVSDPSVTE